MDNLPVKAKDKKLNIFQRIRLEIFKRREFTMDRYIKAPEYIKANNSIVSKIINNEKNCTEKNLLQIPLDILNKEVSIRNYYLIHKWPIEAQIRFINKYPHLRPFDNEQAFFIIDKAIEDGQFSFISLYQSDEQPKYLKYLEENGRLINNLPNILKHLDSNIINKLVEQKPALLIHLDKEQQIEYAQKNQDYFKYINSEIQLEYMQQHPEYIKLASDIAQEKFVLLDINNFQKTSNEFQLKTIAKSPKFYEYASQETQEKIWNDINDNIAMEAMSSILRYDITKSKNLNLKLTHNKDQYNPEKQYIGDGRDTHNYMELFQNIEDIDINTLKRIFLHSKLISAKGKLLPNDIILHGSTSEEIIAGMDDYSVSQINTIKSLSFKQIEELINIDSNYVLPYLVGKDKNADNINRIFYALDEQDIQSSKMSCERLFTDLYGKDKFDNIKECINAIYELQSKEYTRFMEGIPSSIVNSATKKEDFEKLKQLENIPLNQFKILFNQAIINNNPEEIIKQYFNKMSSGEDNSEEFRTMIENAYGSRAREILESRPELNVHNINSLEVFDSRIIDNFGEAFVHDAISYNLRDFSGFLDIIKDENRLESFKTYYNVLTSVMGHNVETMQKAISEYIYNEEILENVKEIELTEKQYDNLISVLCSKDNKYDIRTLQQLQNFDEIANQQIRKQLSTAKTPAEIKAIISEGILGLDFKSVNHNDRNYGENFHDIVTIYDISSEMDRESIYTEEQLEILQVMNFIHQENNPVKLKQLAEELMSQRGIKNPMVTYDVVNKIKENQIELFNESLLSTDSMEELVKKEEGKDNPLITKTVEDGITKYSLEGIEFKILIHDTGNIRNTRQYEGQLGNNAICCRLITDKNIGGNLGQQGFTNVEKTSGVMTYYSQDGDTNHLPKLVRGKGRVDHRVGEDLTTCKNEVAFYRRYRNHDSISNDNAGGRRIQDLYIIYVDEDVSKYSEELKQYLRENNIPVVYINQEKYEELQRKQELEENKKQEVSDEGR